MNTAPIRFRIADVAPHFPPPGCYLSTIAAARLKKSKRGNRMLQVGYLLNDVPPPYGYAVDYFVLDGASANAVSLARHRLVQLYHACGYDPNDGDPIQPTDLIDTQVSLTLEHDSWCGEPCWRVQGYGPAANRTAHPSDGE